MAHEKRPLGWLILLLVAVLTIDGVVVHARPRKNASARRPLDSILRRVADEPTTTTNDDTNGTDVTASGPKRNAKVLILGGGVAGIIAARTFKQGGIDDILLIEGRDELGGRMRTRSFGNFTIELGANWIQGTQTGNGPENPIWTLAKKYKVNAQFNDFGDLSTYDDTGAVDYLGAVDAADENLANFNAGAHERISSSSVDLSARAGYAITGSTGKDKYAAVSEYYDFDFEFSQTPEQSSWLASSWNNDYTYDIGHGGFSEENLLSIDQRGFKTLILGEANQYLNQNQTLLNSVVKNIQYSANGVTVILKNGQVITGDYALCTFSVGVLQNNDVVFSPPLPDYKREAISSMAMGVYTKIFLQFPTKFWFDTEMALYADSERGVYPVWQSLDHPKYLPGSRILFVTVTGDYSERIEGMSDGQVKNEVMGVLRKMYPHVQVPDPVDFFFPRWASDPLYRGSYSNWPASFVTGHHQNLRTNVDRLYFAGEATSIKYFGFLQGAYFEGMSMAQSIIKKTDLVRSPEIVNSVPYNFGG